MGLFGFMSETRQEKQARRRHINMNQEELLALDNEGLYDAITDRVEYIIQYLDSAERLEKLKAGVRVFYIVQTYELEVNNGGLCQYFVNSSRLTAPYLMENLREIGANKHADLLADFLDKNGISLDDLSSFAIDDIDDFEEQEGRFPFDEFDDGFYALYDEEHLSDVLVEYVRAHIEEFAEE
ncbi:MAG: DUF4375 domain-containing protein [Eubacterium sp.]|nr:DUF4375 domain-containing protein [Candidatus Colimonas fimequi]